MSPEKNLKALKTLVISMGVLLVVGFFIACAGAWMKFRAPAAACASHGVDLSGKGRLVFSALDGDTLRLLFARDKTREVVLLEVCSGKVLNSLTIRVDE